MGSDLTTEILEWVQEQDFPNWKIDLLRRIARGELIGTERVKQYADWAEQEASQQVSNWISAPETTETDVVASINADDFGIRAQLADPIVIKNVTHLHGVNRLKNGACLSFTADGLNLVYGHNGAGKSGFARILKQFGATRGPETILPNALGSDETPAASIAFQSGNQSFIDGWGDQSIANSGQLKRVRIFDSLSARTHIRDSNEVAFIPPQLENLTVFVDVLDRIKHELRDRNDGLVAHSRAWDDVTDKTLETLVGNLGENAGKKAIEGIANFTDDDRKRLEEIEVELRQLEATSPAQIVFITHNQKAQVDMFRQILSTLSDSLKASKLHEFRRIETRLLSARRELEDQARTLEKYDNFHRVSDDNWREMWDAAVDFHASEVNSNLHESTMCPLCQQEIHPETRERFRLFQEFAEGEKAAAVKSAEQASKSFYFQIQSLDVKRPRVIAENSEFIGGLVGGSGAEHVKTLWASVMGDFRRKRRVLLRVIENGPGDITPPSRTSIEIPERRIDVKIQELSSELQKLSERLGAQEQRNRQLSEADPEDNELIREVMALRTKRVLYLEKEALKESQDLACRKKALKMAQSDCSGTGLTRLNKKLSTEYIEAISSSFQEELVKLGMKNKLPVDLRFDVAKKGINHIRVVYNEDKSNKVGEILSEGEQRVISLAGFFADLTNNADRSTLVFDDPVSSLDHRFRQAVAKRLVEESTMRQVIVFTHDYAFVRLIEEARSDFNASSFKPDNKTIPEINVMEMMRTKEGAGVNPPKTWRRAKLKEQIAHLRQMGNQLRSIEKNEPDRYPHEAEVLVAALREVWERVVEEKLLNAVVTRMGRGVQTQRLRLLTDISESDIEKVDRGMTIESRLMIGHSAPMELAPDEYPNADEICLEIEYLYDYSKELSKRGRS